MWPPRCSKTISVRSSSSAASATVTSSKTVLLGAVGDREAPGGWAAATSTVLAGPAHLLAARRRRASSGASAPPGRTSIVTDATRHLALRRRRTSPRSARARSTPPTRARAGRRRRGRCGCRGSSAIVAASRSSRRSKPLRPEARGSARATPRRPRSRVALEPRRAQPARAAARDQAGLLEHLEVARDRLRRDRERLGELVDRRLALGQATEDRAPRGVGQRGERARSARRPPPSLHADRFDKPCCVEHIDRRRWEAAMGRVVVTEFVSLDGVMEAPRRRRRLRPRRVDASSSTAATRATQFKTDETMDADALLLGRRTYEGFAAAWPGARAASSPTSSTRCPSTSCPRR